ncbi:MAG TPA: DNA methyltransferase [Aromatoleum sp.]|uniref:class I SAM-dependent DNA methyltransferase n=1 Tax=Aromatoleum sp. TaxID=2307007 RepID=UPI002B4A9AD8|nr:DNA methyltransferase [Aromatoleum sp.]HJV25331.1 DNA methyltransferase [Aromatoleum sp.]
MRLRSSAVTTAVDPFILRWQKAGGSERANYQLFLTELCALLDLPQPEPAGDDTRDNAYVFERRVVMRRPDGSSNNGFIDLYRRGAFVLEAKQTGKTLDSSGWDKAMLRAHNQADQYARALPADEGRPPFILVTDVGRNIELYAEFSRSGATYTPFPDPRNHRIRLEDLRREDIRERLRTVWLDPLALDPARRSARVTREIADRLATLAKSLEAAGHAPQKVAGFLMRALFTMFAEDVGLLPVRSFTDLLLSLKDSPLTFAPMLEHLWQNMNVGGFSPILRGNVLRFNGGLFSDATAIPLDRDQLELLLKASQADWRYVEPAIFGTLLERALDSRERHKLGAHYTPRAYVERLVLPTVIEPLRSEWKEVQTAALAFEQQGKHKEAVAEIRAFHRHLCDVRVLDPACGSGNFLYVTLEHLKRLEGEVLNVLHDLGESQGLLELEGVTVDPHQFLGLEINPRAAKIAEMVLWIGYLQWHFRTHGSVSPPEPVLRDFRNIQHRDALIEYDCEEIVTDAAGRPVTRWDGVTYKPSPVTGEPIPDERAQIVQVRYANPRKAEWPQADFIVGNPPYIGARRIRQALGDGYLSALRSTYAEVPEHADLVMYWWAIASDAVGARAAQSFGLITTNSLRQSFSRKVIETSFERNPALGIRFVVPDHPWVDSSDGAAVRVALTTVSADSSPGVVARVVRERPAGDGEIEVDLTFESGHITPNLTIGVDPGQARALKANRSMACVGYQLTGQGFVVTEEQAKKLEDGGNLHGIVRPLMTGRDITQRSRGLYAIDLFGLSEADLLRRYPSVYQWVVEWVKPERDHNNRTALRARWWIFGEARSTFRPALLDVSSIAVTSLTAKHRVFVKVPADTICDSTTVMFAMDDLGTLSSRIHVCWALAAGGTLEDRPRYNKNVCFETFPFPDATLDQQARIRDLAEQLDAHRKRQQAQHPDLTLTAMYNVLEKLRSGEVLSAKDKAIHEHGLVSVLRELHDALDAAVFDAYGWNDLATALVGRPGATTPLPDKPEALADAEGELLRRLFELNAQRAAEEARGLVRWQRPEYQNSGAAVPQQFEVELGEMDEVEVTPAVPAGKLAWPKNMRQQVAVVRAMLVRQRLPLEAIAGQFKRSPKAAVLAVLEALEELGMVRREGEAYGLQG